jgi:hypothetical protein
MPRSIPHASHKRASAPAVTVPAGRLPTNRCGIPITTVTVTVTPATRSQYRA